MSFHTHFLLRLISVHFTGCINRTVILILFVDIIVISNQIYILIHYISTLLPSRNCMKTKYDIIEKIS